ncbi:MAG: M23 family metallopeptidase [Bacillota bacterium]
MLKKINWLKVSRWQRNNLLSRLFFVVLSLGVTLGALSYHLGQVAPSQGTTYQDALFYAVYINGQEMGLLAEKEALEEIRETLQQEASVFYGRPVLASVDVDCIKVYRPLAEEDPEKVTSQLRNALRYKIEALMVTVGGQDVVPVADQAALENVIATIASAYIPQKDNVSLKDVQIVEQIDCRPIYCYPEELRDADTVAAILLRGTDRRETYLVSRGDSLWEIASNYNLSVEELREANPQLQGDLLQIGDELSLIVPEPLVNVITVERVSVSEKIPFQTVYVPDATMWSGQTKVLEKGVFGSRDVVYEVIRENGQEISREIVSSEIITEPVIQKVAQGTASIPSRGTGSFNWPVQGGGRLTSTYGWRSGGFHAGIDIAAPRGTPVLAADSGVVVFAGRDGGYGNCVVIYHGTYYTRYAHNSENLVREGHAVNQGEVIARVGSTGKSTANHLHFEIRTGGIYGPTQNPLKYFSP